MSEEIKNIEDLLDVFEHTDGIYYLGDYSNITIANFIRNLQQKVEQLEKENEYLKMSNPEQNMEHFRVVNENKRKIDMLRKENHQLKNIRKEAIEYLEYQLSQMDFEKDTKAKMLGAMTIVLLSKGSDKE